MVLPLSPSFSCSERKDMNTKQTSVQTAKKSDLRLNRSLRRFIQHKDIFIMSLPIIAFYIIFCYLPMYGVIISFKDYSPKKGILGSPNVGLQHFKDFFNSYYFGRLLGNTVKLSFFSLLWGFPAPIIFALLLNEVGSKRYKKVIQTITYMPNFISLVVIAGLIKDFVDTQGMVTDLLVFFGFDRQNLLLNAAYFRTIYIASGIWQSLGFSSIIYLAAISNASEELYEAAEIDGAGRLRKIQAVTLPALAPTIITLLILQIGNLMSVGYEKVLLLYNDNILKTADIISTFVYRKGLLEFNYSYSAAIGLFNSIINCILIVIANQMSRKLTDTSLW